jgi:hypothetical protein
MAGPTGLIETAFGLFRPLRGALRASKTLPRFVEQGSHRVGEYTKTTKVPREGALSLFGAPTRLELVTPAFGARHFDYK